MRNCRIFLLSLVCGVGAFWIFLAGTPLLKTVEPVRQWNYPETPRRPVQEKLHGVTVVDPYRWLEDLDSKEVKRWIEAQNRLSLGFIRRLPRHRVIARRMRALLSIGDVGVPVVRKGRYFYTRRVKGMNQPVLVRRIGRTGKEIVVINPNRLDKKGLVSLDWWYPSPDGRYIAYGLSREGNEWSTLYVADLKSMKKLKDVIPRTRYASVAWLPDGSGFYYTRYPQPGDVPEGEENYHRHLYFHRLGRDYHEDQKIFGEGRDPREFVSASLSKDGRYLLLHASTFGRTWVYLMDRQSPKPEFLPIIENVEAETECQILLDRLICSTNLDAPNYRIVAASLEHPQSEHWKTIIPEGKDAISGFRVIGGTLFVRYNHHAHHLIRRYDLAGRELGTVDVPDMSTLSVPSGELDGDEAFIRAESFTAPPRVYRYDLKQQKLEPFISIRAPLDPSRFEVKQVWYPSTDGVRVSMFLIYPKGLQRNGKNPTLLYGYGGFNISLTPRFLAARLFWVEQGGVVAIPNLRGGGEYGERWHRAGMRDKKQNVFNDFIQAAAWLIENRYTNSKRLAIQGGSNGGLLVGAVLTQRPGMFAAVHSAVPLMDMIRYTKFLIARLWIPEYGDPDKPEDFKWLYAYSPYHHVRKGIRYPAVLITTALSDSRVHPSHALKMAAMLQWANASEKPIFLRVETEAGHGVGKPVTKRAEEAADVYTFLTWAVGMPVK